MTLQVSADPDLNRIDLPTDLADAFHRLSNQEDPPETLSEGIAIIQLILDESDVDVYLVGHL